MFRFFFAHNNVGRLQIVGGLVHAKYFCAQVAVVATVSVVFTCGECVVALFQFLVLL